MSEQNKAVVRRLSEELWNKRNVNVLDEIFAANFTDHTPMPGAPGNREGFKSVVIGLQTAFPDGRSSVDDVIAENDKVVWRWTFSGTHRGPLMGISATGKRVSMTGITIDRIVRGQIVERWSQIDNLGMMQQLGVIPGPVN